MATQDPSPADPAQLYPADPNWLDVSRSITAKEAILLSLNIDPTAIAELEDLARSQLDVDPLTPKEDFEHRLTQLGMAQGEYEKRMDLVRRALAEGTLPFEQTVAGPKIQAPVCIEWLLTRGWKVPAWLRQLQPSARATRHIQPSVVPNPTYEPGSGATFEVQRPASAATTEPDQMLSITEVIRLAGIGKTTIYELIKEGSFPDRRKAGKSSLWSRAEVIAWMQSLPRSNQAGRKQSP